MIVYEVEDADAMKKREALMIRAKIPSSFLVYFANLEINLDENPASIETQFFFSIVPIPETGAVTRISRSFCEEELA